ncbi:SDR family oxidoreductase [Streptomyces sp. NPDC059009]|uniref:SDR family oxidoreductase n=1 Tax=Streptomyces sp. NPDC059009 TaxID=3346694 RepID=UPI0036B21C71
MGVLSGKTALVTGASRGIGRGIAQRLASEGALVAVHFGHDGEAARDTVEMIKREKGEAFLVRAEFGVPGDVETLYSKFDEGLAQMGASPEFDILVNNAAISGSARIDQVTPELFDRLFSVNARALLFTVQQGLKRMRDGGRIINISSAVTRISYPESVVYSMTKGALNIFTLAMAKQLGDRGITVNAVAPGFVETDMNAGKRATPEAAAELASWSVFDRIGQPGDIAELVAFLASDASRWVTGQCIDASGGSKL